MRESNSIDSVVLIIAVIAMLLLLAGGGVAWMWLQQQRQVALVQREHAMAAAAEARAEAQLREAEIDRVRQQAKLEDAAIEDAAIEDAAIEDAANADTAIEDAVRRVLEDQRQAWNTGDVDHFMQGYWKSAELSFSSAGTTTRGWQETLAGYQQRYPTAQDMGQLSFSDLEVTPLGGEAALVLGTWQLARDAGDVGGNFTLVFRHVDDQWVIVHDHTSRSATP